MKGSLIQERISRLAEGIQADCLFAAPEPRGRAGCNCRRGDVRCHPEIGLEIPDAIVATTADASELTSISGTNLALLNPGPKLPFGKRCKDPDPSPYPSIVRAKGKVFT